METNNANESKEIEQVFQNDNEGDKSRKLILNAIHRENGQRNFISKGLDIALNDELILISDVDEIPNLENINLNSINKEIILFKQDMFYYKFNLSLPKLNWYGSKACQYKNLITISELRNIKPKKYGWWRFDTMFKKNKFIDIKVINNGGWHFTEIKTPEEIYIKHSNDEHHDEFDRTGINEENIKDMIKNRYTPYDHSIDQKDWEKKWNKDNRIKLSVVSNLELPQYLINNKIKYKDWFDQNE